MDLYSERVAEALREFIKTPINYNAGNLASGIYFYRLEAKSKVSNKNFSKVGKMILFKYLVFIKLS